MRSEEMRLFRCKRVICPFAFVCESCVYPFAGLHMKKEDIAPAIRHFLYLVGAFGLSFFQHFMAEIFHEATYADGAIIENLQIVFLVISLLVFLYVGFKFLKYQCISLVLSSLCAFAVCREMDNWFDEVLPCVSWRIGFVFLLLAGYFVKKHWKKFLLEIVSFIRTTPFSMLCDSAIIILPIAQLIGHKQFLMNVMPDYLDSISSVKEIFEESLETFGYFLILCAAIELFLQCKKDVSQETSRMEENNA